MTTCGRDFASAHQVTNVFLQELVVVIKLVVLFANGFDTVEDSKKGVLQGFGMSTKVSDCNRSSVGSIYLLISSRAAFPILSRSSLVLLGLIALTSSGPKSGSRGPTAELSRGTTNGPLLFL